MLQRTSIMILWNFQCLQTLALMIEITVPQSVLLAKCRRVASDVHRSVVTAQFSTDAS